MAKLTSTASEKVNNNMATQLEPVLQQVATGTKPMVITGVQRKANTGNYENVDIYCAVVLPVDVAEDVSRQELNKAISDAIADGFEMASRETYTRYKIVKEQ